MGAEREGQQPKQRQCQCEVDRRAAQRSPVDMPVHVFHPALPRAMCRLPDPTRLLSARYLTRLVGRGYADNMANAFDPVSELSALLTEVSQLKTNARAAVNPSPPAPALLLTQA